MALKIHNTLTDKLEEFQPVKSGEARMYNCGPTVYNYAHIGNLRAYVSADIFRRTLEYLGYQVKQAINITDIGHLSSDSDSGDDKMVKGLKREGLPLTLEGLKKLADKYEGAFVEDIKALNIKMPEHLPRATSSLEEEIELVKKLEEKGFAYKTEDGIYFNTEKLLDYGRLGGLTPVSESKTRVEKDKKNPRDFVLWKFSSDEKLSFPSPWGSGFPGWHIECSAMSRKFLGQPFDIHTGGTDHIPVHHNNEIAQSEAAYDTPLANYWLHVAFVILDGNKMAKSDEDFLTLSDLKEKGFSPFAYRYFLLLSHYRTPTTFSWEALEAANNAYNKLVRQISVLPDGGKVNTEYEQKFREKMENDFNTAQALAVLWTMMKDSSLLPEDKKTTVLEFDKILGLSFA